MNTNTPNKKRTQLETEEMFDQIRKNMALAKEAEKKMDRAELCERYDGECTICPRGNTCRSH